MIPVSLHKNVHISNNLYLFAFYFSCIALSFSVPTSVKQTATLQVYHLKKNKKTKNFHPDLVRTTIPPLTLWCDGNHLKRDAKQTAAIVKTAKPRAAGGRRAFMALVQTAIKES